MQYSILVKNTTRQEYQEGKREGARSLTTKAAKQRNHRVVRQGNEEEEKAESREDFNLKNWEDFNLEQVLFGCVAD